VKSWGVLSRATPYLLVALGGALGAVARFAVATGFARRFGTGWPWGTLFINVTGSFIIAVLAARLTSANLRYLLPIGFVGAYTTFSTYEFEAMRLFQLGQAPGALVYVAASNLLGFGAVLLGAWVAR
jgi:CrcB protein